MPTSTKRPYGEQAANGLGWSQSRHYVQQRLSTLRSGALLLSGTAGRLVGPLPILLLHLLRQLRRFGILSSGSPFLGLLRLLGVHRSSHLDIFVVVVQIAAVHANAQGQHSNLQPTHKMSAYSHAIGHHTSNRPATLTENSPDSILSPRTHAQRATQADTFMSQISETPPASRSCTVGHAPSTYDCRPIQKFTSKMKLT